MLTLWIQIIAAIFCAQNTWADAPSCNDVNLLTPGTPGLAQLPVEDQFEIGACHAFVASQMLNHELRNVMSNAPYVDPFVLDAQRSARLDSETLDDGGYVSTILEEFEDYGYCDPSPAYFEALTEASMGRRSQGLTYQGFTQYVHALREEISSIQRSMGLSVRDAVDVIVWDESYTPRDTSSLSVFWASERSRESIRSLALFLAQSPSQTENQITLIRSDVVDCEDQNYANLQNLSDPIETVLEQDIPQILNHYFTRDCRHQTGINDLLPPSETYRPRDGISFTEHAEDFKQIVDRELSEGSVMGLSICSDFLDGEGSTPGSEAGHLFYSSDPLREVGLSLDHCDTSGAHGRHGVILAGSRSSQSGCEYLIRNSWGPALNPEWGPPGATSCYCEREGRRFDCSRDQALEPNTSVLGCWYRSLDVIRSTYKVDYFD